MEAVALLLPMEPTTLVLETKSTHILLQVEAAALLIEPNHLVLQKESATILLWTELTHLLLLTVVAIPLQVYKSL